VLCVLYRATQGGVSTLRPIKTRFGGHSLYQLVVELGRFLLRPPIEARVGGVVALRSTVSTVEPVYKAVVLWIGERLFYWPDQQLVTGWQRTRKTAAFLAAFFGALPTGNELLIRPIIH
jgi:hypothetical protein